jgi:hypothetical protein
MAPPFITSALDGDEWLAPRFSGFTLGEISPGTNWTGDWMGPRACLEAIERKKYFPPQGTEFRLSSPQFVAILSALSRLS